MAKAVAIYTGGITDLRQAAIREDGVVFSRCQEKRVYGYVWTSWRATGETVGANALEATPTLQSGFASLRRATVDDCFINNRALFDAKGNIRVRLP